MLLDKKQPIILASNSPQRKKLLEKSNILFKVFPSTLEEIIDPSWTPEETVIALAKQKAKDVVAKINHTKYQGILAADTIVVLNNKIMGKPKNNKEAYSIIWSLSRNEHDVITGVCLYTNKKYHTFFSTTKITMNPMTEKDIHEYIATNDVLTRAGGIDIENIQCIHEIKGDFENVIGLPIKEVLKRWFKDTN